MLILAKRRGLIPSISPGIQALRDAGLWLSDNLVNYIETTSRGIGNGELGIGNWGWISWCGILDKR